MNSPIRTVLYGTSTNYLKTFVRMAGGIITFRLLFKTLSQQDFGFYQLLWSTFGYVVLLDFGFGVSVQRAMAVNVYDVDDASRLARREAISTVFFTYLAIDLVLGVGFLLFGDRLFSMLHATSPAELERYRAAAGIFALGMLLGFPLGIYREALRGLNRIHVTNLIDTAFFALSTIAVAWGCLSHWSLGWLMTASIATTVLPIAVSFLVAQRNPDLRPSIRHFRWNRMRTLSSFSLIAYVITMTGLIMSQCDQLVIGSLVSLQAIALYVPGFKITGFYGAMSSQMQDTLGPIAAQFSGLADGEVKTSKLTTLLLTSQRWAVMSGTLFVLPLLADSRTALALMTGVADPPADMRNAALLLIVGTYLALAAASCSKRILMMAGYHRGMLAFSVAEAVINLAMSLYLTHVWRNCVGTAAGTLIAIVCVSLIAVPAYAARKLGLPFRSLVATSGRALLANVGAIIAAGLWWRFVPAFHPTWHFMLGGALCAVAALPGWWRLGMLEPERERLRRAFRFGSDNRALSRT